jgi:uncharacterized protein YcbX
VSQAAEQQFGTVVSLWRYPVKSMMGEELNAAGVDDRGLFGDRAYAVLDRSDGKVASAKNPRKWPRMFDFRASFADPPRRGAPPAVRITLPEGAVVASDQEEVDQLLSRAFGRDVTLQRAHRSQEPVVESTFPNPWTTQAEEYWPDIEGLDYRDTVTDFELPEGTFFDCAVVHLLTTATLDRLRELYPQGRFEVRRFRPNIVVASADGATGFIEDAWIDQTVRIGDEVQLSITGPCPRCVMTTLAQADLPKDSRILRTAAQHNQVNVGVYASVLRGGRIRRGDAVRLQ